MEKHLEYLNQLDKNEIDNFKRTWMHNLVTMKWLKTRHVDRAKKQYLFFPEELHKHYEINELFRGFDADQSEGIDIQELINMFKDNKILLDRQDVEAIFKIIDFNGDHTLNLSEFKKSVFSDDINTQFAQVMRYLRQKVEKRDEEIDKKKQNKILLYHHGPKRSSSLIHSFSNQYGNHNNNNNNIASHALQKQTTKSFSNNNSISNHFIHSSQNQIPSQQQQSSSSRDQSTHQQPQQNQQQSQQQQQQQQQYFQQQQQQQQQLQQQQSLNTQQQQQLLQQQQELEQEQDQVQRVVPTTFSSMVEFFSYNFQRKEQIKKCKKLSSTQVGQKVGELTNLMNLSSKYTEQTLQKIQKLSHKYLFHSYNLLEDQDDIESNKNNNQHNKIQGTNNDITNENISNDKLKQQQIIHKNEKQIQQKNNNNSPIKQYKSENNIEKRLSQQEKIEQKEQNTSENQLHQITTNNNNNIDFSQFVNTSQIIQQVKQSPHSSSKKINLSQSPISKQFLNILKRSQIKQKNYKKIMEDNSHSTQDKTGLNLDKVSSQSTTQLNYLSSNNHSHHLSSNLSSQIQSPYFNFMKNQNNNNTNNNINKFNSQNNNNSSNHETQINPFNSNISLKDQTQLNQDSSRLSKPHQNKLSKILNESNQIRKDSLKKFLSVNNSPDNRFQNNKNLRNDGTTQKIIFLGKNQDKNYSHIKNLSSTSSKPFHLFCDDSYKDFHLFDKMSQTTTQFPYTTQSSDKQQQQQQSQQQLLSNNPFSRKKRQSNFMNNNNNSIVCNSSKQIPSFQNSARAVYNNNINNQNQIQQFNSQNNIICPKMVPSSDTQVNSMVSLLDEIGTGTAQAIPLNDTNKLSQINPLLKNHINKRSKQNSLQDIPLYLASQIQSKQNSSSLNLQQQLSDQNNLIKSNINQSDHNKSTSSQSIRLQFQQNQSQQLHQQQQNQQQLQQQIQNKQYKDYFHEKKRNMSLPHFFMNNIVGNNQNNKLNQHEQTSQKINNKDECCDQKSDSFSDHQILNFQKDNQQKYINNKDQFQLSNLNKISLTFTNNSLIQPYIHKLNISSKNNNHNNIIIGQKNNQLTQNKQISKQQSKQNNGQSSTPSTVNESLFTTLNTFNIQKNTLYSNHINNYKQSQKQ